MSRYPLTHSDVQCHGCLEYFRHEPDLYAHRERANGCQGSPDTEIATSPEVE